MFAPEIEALTSKYGRKGVLIDSNLLLLLVVGVYRRDRISTFKRTAKFTKNDFSLLNNLMKRFERVLTTPNILTEVDNLGRQLSLREHDAFALALKKTAVTFIEEHRHFETAAKLREFSRYGLSDTVSFLLTNDCLLLSDDLPLYTAVTRAGRDAINFNHLRL